LQPSSVTDKIRSAFTENLHLKAIAFIVAIVLWVIVSGQRNAEWAYLVPLEIKHKPEDIIITNHIPNFIDVRVQGPKSFIMGLKPEEMAIKLNVSAIEIGSNILPITAKSISVPRGARITRINPSYITLEAEKLVRKMVKIKPELAGEPAEDYLVESVDVEPPAIEIMAAESELKGIKFLKTNSINISGFKENFKKSATIDTLGRKIIFPLDEPINVTVRIKEVTARLELKGVDLKLIKGDLKTEVKPLKIRILIEGPKSVIASIDETGLIASVDTRDLPPGAYNMNVDLKVPETVTILNIRPKEVKVKISQ